MRDAVENKITFDRRRPELRYFPVENTDWLNDNLNQFKDLISENINKLNTQTKNESYKLISSVSQERILDFLEKFHFHEEEKSVIKGSLIKYANLLFKKKLLKNWNIVIVSRKNEILKDGTNLGSININNVLKINCINRAKLGSSSNPAHLKLFLLKMT